MKNRNVFDKLADVIVKRSKLIIAIWIAVLIGSVAIVMTQESTLNYDMTQMSMRNSPESIVGMEMISDPDKFYQDPNATETIIVVQFADITDANSFNSKLNDLSEATITRQMVAPDDRYGYIAVYSVGYGSSDVTETIPELRNLIQQAIVEAGIENGFVTYVTGTDAINYDTETGSMEDVSKIDIVSIFLILILIGLFFRSFVAAATPPLVVGAAYGVMLSVLFFIGGVLDIFYISPIIMLVSMLGAGCDYCIFVIARYREERRSGKDKEGALRESVRWAGESITTSGLSVIIGFGVMSFCSFSLMSSMGIVLALGIVVALLAALTLIPSIIMILGDRMFYPSTMETYAPGSKAMNGWYGKIGRAGERYFRSAARNAIKYAKPIVLAAVLITIPLTYVTFTQETSYDTIETMPPSESKDGVYALVDNEYVGGGVLMPTYVVVEYKESMATVTMLDPDNPAAGGTLVWDQNAYDSNSYFSRELIRGIRSTDNIQGDVDTIFSTKNDLNQIIAILGDDHTEADIDAFIAVNMRDESEATKNAVRAYLLTYYLDDQYDEEAADYFLFYLGGMISSDGTMMKITFTMVSEPLSSEAMTTIDELRSVISSSMVAGRDAERAVAGVWVTGSAASNYDVSEIVNDEFTWIEIGVVVLIFLLLFFVLKSYFTPLRAIATILMSIMWTLGLTHLLFGGLLNTPVIWMIPIILLVVCLGLGMDYDILLTTRIRENVVKGMSNDNAIYHAVEKTGAVITLCGIIMASAFSTLMISSSPMLQEFGFALGFAIFVDALIVRTYIVPAVMHLMGDWNWKGPKWMHRREKQIPETKE